MDGVHARERDVASAAFRGARLLGGHPAVHGGGIAVERPAFQNGESAKIDFAPIGAFDHVLARAGSNGLRRDPQQRRELPDLRDDFTERPWGLRLRERADAGRDRLEAAPVPRTGEGRFHSVVGPVEIDREREVASFDVLEEQGGPAEPTTPGIERFGVDAGAGAPGEGEAVGDLGDFQNRTHGGRDSVEFAGGVESGDEGLEVRHGSSA